MTDLTRERLAAALAVQASLNAAQLSVEQLLAKLDTHDRLDSDARELQSHSRIIDVSIDVLTRSLKRDDK